MTTHGYLYKRIQQARVAARRGEFEVAEDKLQMALEGLDRMRSLDGQYPAPDRDPYGDILKRLALILDSWWPGLPPVAAVVIGPGALGMVHGVLVGEITGHGSKISLPVRFDMRASYTEGEFRAELDPIDIVELEKASESVWVCREPEKLEDVGIPFVAVTHPLPPMETAEDLFKIAKPWSTQ